MHSINAVLDDYDSLAYESDDELAYGQRTEETDEPSVESLLADYSIPSLADDGDCEDPESLLRPVSTRSRRRDDDPAFTEEDPTPHINRYTARQARDREVRLAESWCARHGMDHQWNRFGSHRDGTQRWKCRRPLCKVSDIGAEKPPLNTARAAAGTSPQRP